MEENIQENQDTFDNTSLVKSAALLEAKKKTGEAKSFLRRLADAGKKEVKDRIGTPEQMVSRAASGVIGKVKSSLKGKGPRAKSKR
tara:strand:+ start:1537 stop:1794 length:258 start_codon:yes stop_codon:yes gene_type:complete